MVSANESNTSPESTRTLARERALRAPMRFYKKRSRFYTLLLLLVVLIGLPIVGVPHLRNRLSARIMQLKSAVAGNVNPIVAQVGASQEPFPSEYERPKPPVAQAYRLPAAKIIPPPKVYVPGDPSGIEPPEVLDLDESPIIYEGEGPAAQGEIALDKTEESGPKYGQGENEQKAYDLLLESNSRIAGLVQGSDSSIVFDSWDAAHRGDDVYWVRVKLHPEGNPVREYIFQINLNSGEIIPLSYHARSIS